MAMTVLNNSATMISLGELNKNINKLGKALTVVSTGQKLNSAADDSASFAISEVMRSKIRSLEQDVQNVQNGSAMLKTAQGGIQNIVDELRDLKQLAIDAANDSNMDDDRRVMQKVVKQTLASIDDIAAHTTFNSKPLLDGTYAEPHWKEIYKVEYKDSLDDNAFGDEGKYIARSMVLRKVSRDNIVNSEDKVSEDLNVNDLVNKNVNINVVERLNDVTGLASAFEAMHNGVTFADGSRAVETRDTALYAQRPENIKSPESSLYAEDQAEFENLPSVTTRDSVVPNRNFIRASGGAPLAVRMDFSGARGSDGKLIFANGIISDIEQLNNQGFSILNSDSSHFVNFVFDTSSNEVDWNNINKLGDDSGAEDTSITGDIEYKIGINGCDGMSHSEFLNYIFQRFKESETRKTKIGLINHELGHGISFLKENSNNLILSQQFNLRMVRDNDGNVYLTKFEPYSYNLGILDEGILKDKYIKAGDTLYGIGEAYEYKADYGNPLWIQFGTQAGQHTNLYINGMYNSDLGTDALDVSTRDRAQASIDYIDVALEYALDQATSVGAYLERMEYTEANVEIERDNVQSAESTIRDADMAKAITDYTKNNILLQASQSMLAQSNQSLSGVLGLLQ